MNGERGLGKTEIKHAINQLDRLSEIKKQTKTTTKKTIYAKYQPISKYQEEKFKQSYLKAHASIMVFQK